MPVASNISGFSQKNLVEKQGWLQENFNLSKAEMDLLQNSAALPLNLANNFVDNCIGIFPLPLGIATNFLLDGEDILLPMAVEESSVVAAASHAAKLVRAGGGFVSQPVEGIATSQVEFKIFSDIDVEQAFSQHKTKLQAIANATQPRLLARGGGVVNLELRKLSPKHYVIHLHVNTCEAMGANIVNTMAEEVGKHLPSLISCTVGLKILTNLTVNRIVQIECNIPIHVLARNEFSGEVAAQRIQEAYEFADLCPFRASTHNKGIMNGIDPVVIATGNDWRAVEAGCHAWAAFNRPYGSLTTWTFQAEKQNLHGLISVPIAVGTVGGVTTLHPLAKLSLKLMGEPSSIKLSKIIAMAGLAQNLAALRALACEGIQSGHMRLHRRAK